MKLSLNLMKFETLVEEPIKVYLRRYGDGSELEEAFDLTNLATALLNLILGGLSDLIETPSVRLMWSQFTAYEYTDVAELISDVFPFNSAYEVIGDNAVAIGLMYLQPGVYSMRLRIAKTPEGGIISVSVGGVTQISNYDTYQAVPEYNILVIVNDIELAGGGETGIAITIQGKNAASADYRLTLSEVVMVRTGDLP